MVQVMLKFLLSFLLVTVVMATKPVLIALPKNQTVNVGDEARISCESYGNPTPSMILEKISDEEAVLIDLHPNVAQVEPDLHGIVTSTQIMSPVSKSDEGWYMCRVSNTYGDVVARSYLNVVDLCDDIKCSKREYCFANTELGIGECRCSECNDKEFEPVCASDCQTYQSVCHMKKKSCEIGIPLWKESRGICNVEEATVSVQETDISVNKDDTVTLSCKVTGNPAPINARWVRKLANGRVQTVSKSPIFTLKKAKKHKAGDYQCVARQCNRKLSSEIVTIRVEDNIVDEPVPESKTCTVYGDPHILTFDGKRYDYQGQCTYMLAMDCQAFTWMLMGRFMNCGPGVSCLQDLTLWMGSQAIILGRGWLVGENGSKFRMRKGQEVTLATDVKVKFTGRSLILTLSNGVKMTYDGFWGITVTVPQDAVTCGICSDNNGNPDDDLYRGRYSYGPNTIESFAESWKLGQRRCYSESQDATKVKPDEMDCKAANATCESVINDPALSQCLAKIGKDEYLQECKKDMCYAEVPRFTGSKTCAYINSLALHCEEAGVPLRQDYMEYFTCDLAELQEAVYNSGCPLIGVPGYLDEQ